MQALPKNGKRKKSNPNQAIPCASALQNIWQWHLQGNSCDVTLANAHASAMLTSSGFNFSLFQLKFNNWVGGVTCKCLQGCSIRDKVNNQGKVLFWYNQVRHALEEKRVMASVSYPFVLTMVHCFKDNANLYVLMPYLPCGDLFGFLTSQEFLDEATAAFLSAQIVLGLEYLHDNDVIYRWQFVWILFYHFIQSSNCSSSYDDDDFIDFTEIKGIWNPKTSSWTPRGTWKSQTLDLQELFTWGPGHSVELQSTLLQVSQLFAVLVWWISEIAIQLDKSG